MALKSKKVSIVDLHDWDTLVKETYGKPYSFQQQDGCKERQLVYINVPESEPYDYENSSVPEIVNHDEMGVSFAAWIARDPKQLIENRSDEWATNLWWSRNFYPHIDMIINDLHSKGIIEEGSYAIEIDW